MAPIVDELIDLFADVIGVETAGVQDGEGTITYGASVDRVCRIGGGHMLVRDRDGRQQTSTVQVWIAGSFGLTADDRYTLPAGEGFDPLQPKAISIGKWRDEDGAHHEKVFF